LLRLQLIELIRSAFKSGTMDESATETAIKFARDNLAPYVNMSPNFKNDLERAMTLLIMPPAEWVKLQQADASSTTQRNSFGALSELVDPSLRKKVAKDVNEAILASQGQRREANIRHLVRTRTWAEQLAREKKVDLPKRLNLGLDGEEDDHNGGDTEMSGNGADIGDVRSQSRPTSGITEAVMASYSQQP
jgi:glucose-induced degradation protein 8